MSAIDKTFHHSDPEHIVCWFCNNCYFNYDKGYSWCRKRNEHVEVQWTCDDAER